MRSSQAGSENSVGTVTLIPLVADGLAATMVAHELFLAAVLNAINSEAFIISVLRLT